MYKNTLFNIWFEIYIGIYFLPQNTHAMLFLCFIMHFSFNVLSVNCHTHLKITSLSRGEERGDLLANTHTHTHVHTDACTHTLPVQCTQKSFISNPLLELL